MADLEQAAVWHRQIAALVAAADRAGVAPDELPAVRARLTAQVAEFTRVASLAGAPLPALSPTAAEVAAVTPALGDFSDAASGQLLRTASATLDAADAALRGAPAPALQTETGQRTLVASAGPPVPLARTGEPAGLGASGATPAEATPPKRKGMAGWPIPLRNGVIYGICTLVTLGLQVALFVAGSIDSLPYYSPIYLLVLPAFGWLAGWLLIGGLYPPPPDGPLNRTPRLGLLICFIPDILICGDLVVSFVRNFG